MICPYSTYGPGHYQKPDLNEVSVDISLVISTENCFISASRGDGHDVSLLEVSFEVFSFAVEIEELHSNLGESC